MQNSTGYIPEFLGHNLTVSFPELSTDLKKQIAFVSDTNNGELKYPHYSLFLHKTRHFPFFTAVNINGTLFKKISRHEIFDSGTDEWRVDDRAKEFQWGPHLYSAKKSDFQRGHMTKREDPQWGTTAEIAKQAARSTFFFSNCVPQIGELNTREWGHLEMYILNKEAVPEKILCSVFTGPVLAADDPVFVSKVDAQDVQIPTHFWKVVYYTNDGKSLSKVGFMMGQENLLNERKIVKPLRMFKAFEMLPEKDYFMDFEDAATYQVNLSTIEKLSGIKFPPAKEPYKDKRPIKLILKDIEVTKLSLESLKVIPEAKRPLDFTYEGIVLR
jgi:endonuclease G, mitochondrial